MYYDQVKRQIPTQRFPYICVYEGYQYARTLNGNWFKRSTMSDIFAFDDKLEGTASALYERVEKMDVPTDVIMDHNQWHANKQEVEIPKPLAKNLKEQVNDITDPTGQ